MYAYFHVKCPLLLTLLTKSAVCHNISVRLTTQIFMKQVISSQSVTSKQRSKAELIFELLKPPILNALG